MQQLGLDGGVGKPGEVAVDLVDEGALGDGTRAVPAKMLQ
jgi:hypothetical protein